MRHDEKIPKTAPAVGGEIRWKTHGRLPLAIPYAAGGLTRR
jgi:hypothetical protein